MGFHFACFNMYANRQLSSCLLYVLNLTLNLYTIFNQLNFLFLMNVLSLNLIAHPYLISSTRVVFLGQNLYFQYNLIFLFKYCTYHLLMCFFPVIQHHSYYYRSYHFYWIASSPFNSYKRS